MDLIDVKPTICARNDIICFLLRYIFYVGVALAVSVCFVLPIVKRGRKLLAVISLNELLFSLPHRSLTASLRRVRREVLPMLVRWLSC